MLKSKDNEKTTKFNLKTIIAMVEISICSILIFIVMNNTFLTQKYSLFFLILISILSSIVMLITMIIILKKQLLKSQYYFYVGCYLLLLIIILFLRNSSDEYLLNQKAYLQQWLKIIFTNKVVFINIIGNIILFIPLGMITKKIKGPFLIKLIVILTLCIMIEFIQYLLKIGVFDIYDILFYLIGILIGYLFAYNFKTIEEK